jgi:hypothetical protein
MVGRLELNCDCTAEADPRLVHKSVLLYNPKGEIGMAEKWRRWTLEMREDGGRSSSFKDQTIRWVQEGEEGGECQGRH